MSASTMLRASRSCRSWPIGAKRAPSPSWRRHCILCQARHPHRARDCKTSCTIPARSRLCRSLKGEKPADLPVQAPTSYETVLNLGTAKGQRIDLPRKATRTRRRGDRINAEFGPVATTRFDHWPNSHLAVAKPVAKKRLLHQCQRGEVRQPVDVCRATDGSRPELLTVLQKAKVTRMITPVRKSSGATR